MKGRSGISPETVEREIMKNEWSGRLEGKIYIAGHRGLVGSALMRCLAAKGHGDILTRSSRELDLRCEEATFRFFRRERPDYVFLAAAKVGGIGANSAFPADFLADNLRIQTNVLLAARETGCRKLLFLGSSCIYPRMAPQPIPEEALLTGPLEETNEPYAIAKIAGIVLARSLRRQYGMNCIAVMPTNLYGPEDNFDLETSHVLPALLRRFVEAKERGMPSVTLWGTGTARREFLHVDDLAEACCFLMENYNREDLVNIGTGEDLSIRELAELIRRIVGYAGEIRWDASRPDGTPRKLLDVSRIRALGWRHRISLEEGIRTTLAWYLASRNSAQAGER
jgi:GDP-L-fucose synthase